MRVEDMKRNMLDQREALAEDMTIQKMESVAIDANDPEKAYENLIRNQEEFLSSIQDMTDSFQPDLEAIHEDIHETLSRYQLNSESTRVETIINALSMPAPTYGQPANQRYLTSKEIRPQGEDDVLIGPVMRYTINPAALKKDVDALGEIAARLPENQRAPFVELQKMLRTYGYRNPDIMEQYLIQHQGPDTQTRAIGKMLKITGFVVFLSLTVITGLMAIARMITNKKIEARTLLAPALFGIITYFIASKSLRKTISDGNEDALKEVDETLNDKQFKKAGLKYDIGGKPWASVYNNPDLQAFDASRATDEERRDFAQHLMPKNAAPQQHEQFLALLDHPDEFASFQRLARVKTPDARLIIREYIELGCSKYYRDMGNVKKTLEEETDVA